MNDCEVPSENQINIAELRAKFMKSASPKSWRGLEELAETDEFLDYLRAEFPRQTAASGELSRRDFLKILAAPLALAGLSACIPQPEERIFPYVNAPEALTPGKPLNYATAMEIDGFGRGLLVQSREGRPIKVEGNPDHPASLGATDAFAQAAVLSLYDPDRSQVITSKGDIRTWGSFLETVIPALEAQGSAQGAGLRLLTGTVTSPSLANSIDRLLQMYPQAKWHQYDPVLRDNIRAGSQLAFGDYVDTHYRFDRARVILSLDADFTAQEPGNLRYVHDFTALRQTPENTESMNRLYVFESGFSNAGAIADHRIPLQAAEMLPLALLIPSRLGTQEITAPPSEAIPLSNRQVDALVEDLQANRGACLILTGPGQPPEMHALVHALNHTLGNVGETVIYTPPVEARPVIQIDSLGELVEDLQTGQVDLLVILGGNPAYTAPANFDLASYLPEAGLTVYLGLYEDETALLCDWHIPSAHFLEMWGDTRAFDGSTTILQPLIEPLYGGVAPHELLAVLRGETNPNGYELIQAYWQEQFGEMEFERRWTTALHDGVIPDSALPEQPVTLQDFSLEGGVHPQAEPNSLEICYEPDPSVWDGRFSNNVWLQELPKPMTKLVWENAALVSPALAEQLGLSNGDVVELTKDNRTVLAPIWILPGLPERTVSVHLGYGHNQGERVARDLGFNAYALRTSNAPWFDYGLEINKTEGRHTLVSTQTHHSMEDRNLVRSGTLDELQHPEVDAHEGELHTLYPEHKYTGHSWGMSINLSTCVGCNACVVACQAENNIPVVGKDQVQAGREMHWLRIDRYFEGGLDNPQAHYQPVPCMHCEHAPCEPVCPVGATVHDEEGLNEMIYNRCIGTRYCSNNCPYKVRRFNFLQYANEEVIPLKLLQNPEVTVRSRGVMEKCTYCVQRINNARIQAEVEGRQLRDGEIKTACQQACPANAIVFGDLNDPSSQVNARKSLPLDYALLAELGARPRTTYLAKVRNPNPDFQSG